MRVLILSIIALSLTACGIEKEDDRPDCDSIAGPQMITYGDGVIRKSDVTICKFKDGRTCTYATWVNDPTITYTDCEE